MIYKVYIKLTSGEELHVISPQGSVDGLHRYINNNVWVIFDIVDAAPDARRVSIKSSMIETIRY